MISFFVKRPWIKHKPSGSTKQRVSSVIRGYEMGKYLHAKINPVSGFENDVQIHIKPNDLSIVKSGSYVDVLDDLKITERMKARPDLHVLAISTPHQDWLATFLESKIFYIPHHHINMERKKRTRKEIIRCGYVGANSPSQRSIANEMKKRLEKVGMEFVSCFNFKKREEILEFYDNIDIQVIGSFDHLADAPHYYPGKIINAMAFGIPTVSCPKLGYRDAEGFYVKVNNMDELVSEAKKLQDTTEYGKWTNKILEEAEKYHISNIATLYQQLV